MSKLTFAEDIRIQIMDNSVEDRDGDWIIQEENFKKLQKDILEVVRNLLPEEKDELNAPFSNRNLKFSDGWNGCLSLIKSKFIRMKITIIIFDTPPSLNEIIGKPFGEVSGIKKRWADQLYVLAYNAGWRPAEKTKYKNCKVTMRFPSKRRIDEDNFRKVIKDALFYADLVWDDSVQKLNFSLKVIPDTGKRETEIELW